MAETPLELLAQGLPMMQQFERLQERLQAGHRLRTVVVILATRMAPPWAMRLDAERVAVVIGPGRRRARDGHRAAAPRTVSAHIRLARAGAQPPRGRD